MSSATQVDQALEDAIFKIGKVISVDGRLVRVKVDKTKNTSHLVYKGQLLKNVAVGGYIKIAKGFTLIVGKVDGEFVEEDKFLRDKAYVSEKERIDRTLNVKLLGFFEGNTFKRGIKELPLVDNECYLLHNTEFDRVHDFLRQGDEPITIGTLALEKGQQIQLGVDGLFASHIGIFGNTGSGKSYTLAKIYRELFEKYKDKAGFRKNAKFILIDFNGEYIDLEDEDVIVDRQYKNVYILSTKNNDGDKFPLTEVTLNSPEFWAVFLEATEKTQRPFLARALANDYLASRLKNEGEFRSLIAALILSVTTKDDSNIERGIVTTFLAELRDCLGNAGVGMGTLCDDYRDHLRFHSTQAKYYYQDGSLRIFSDADNFKRDVVESKMGQLGILTDRLTPIDAIRLRIVIQYYDDIFRGFSNRDHLAPLIKRLDNRIEGLKRVVQVGGLAGEQNITVVSLKDVNIQLRKILPLLICKQLYDDKKYEDTGETYLNIIIDEAHNILSEDSSRESEQWKDYRLETFEEIIKEGRKFGVFLTLASQRPADISPTIISQLHNYFLHRLINEQDIRAVERTIAYLDKVSFEYLPILPTGTCVFAGLLANVPIVIDIGKIDPRKHEPRNKTRTLVDKWT
jgi:DNA helicase HerA-like ATPase